VVVTEVGESVTQARAVREVKVVMEEQVEREVPEASAARAGLEVMATAVAFTCLGDPCL
jgi:hypothetical protein